MRAMETNASSAPAAAAIRPRPNTRGARILLAVVITIIIAAILEVGARLFITGPVQQDFLRAIAGQPDREVQLRSQKRVQQLKYYDYFLYGRAPQTTETMVFTDYYSARRVPASEPAAASNTIIWLFGGSTMENNEVPDDRTAANILTQRLKQSGIRATVYNFGTSSFQSSLELIKFQDLLRRVSPKERPAVAVFYDGYNDSYYGFKAGAGNIQGDLSAKMGALITRQDGRLILYHASEWLARYSVFWERVAAWRISARLFGKPKLDGSPQNLAQTVSTYLANQRMIRATCKEYNIRCLFVLQPMLCTKMNLTAVEQDILGKQFAGLVPFTRDFYSQVRQAAGKNADFVDLSGLLNDSKEWDFYDIGHITPASSGKIGERLAEPLIKACREMNTTRAAVQ